MEENKGEDSRQNRHEYDEMGMRRLDIAL